MAHSSGHSQHGTGRVSHRWAFIIGISLNLIFVAVEILYGLIANSSALLADAGHNASDVLSLAFAWTAAWLATLRPKGKYTYGLRKTTVLVSIWNALLLFGALAAIGWDAVRKLGEPAEVAGGKVMIVAGIGVLINTVTALLFMKEQKEDLNIRGAFLHMAADAIISLGVVVAGLAIHLTGKAWIDPVASFVIIAVIAWSTWRLFTDSVDLALDAVPRHVDLEEVRKFLLSRDGVEDLHDLHIWSMSTTQVALTAHLIMPEGFGDLFIQELQDELIRKFGIGHTTFQIERVSLKDVHPDC